MGEQQANEDASAQPRAAAEKVQVDAPATPKRTRVPKVGSDAARRAGLATREKYGLEHYRRIGSSGGRTTRERQGLEHYSEIGRKGGNTALENQGSEHYVRMGRQGKGRSKPRRSPPTRQDA